GSEVVITLVTQAASVLVEPRSTFNPRSSAAQTPSAETRHARTRPASREKHRRWSTPGRRAGTAEHDLLSPPLIETAGPPARRWRTPLRRFGLDSVDTGGRGPCLGADGNNSRAERRHVSPSWRK